MSAAAASVLPESGQDWRILEGREPEGARRRPPMPRQSLIAAALLLGLALAGPPPALAADEPPADRPEELAREGMDRMLRALELIIEMIPQYEMPEVTEEGDIIIRRKRRQADPPPDPEVEDTET